MNKFIFTVLALVTSICLGAQTIYVDVSKGKDQNSGSMTEPLASLQRAVFMAEQYTGNDPVRIKIGPGLYQLTGTLRIQSGKKTSDTSTYILEATVMPDDSAWSPAAMPVIQSVSANNDQKYFTHCAGILVDRGNVVIRGIKFIGDANPAVDYYYPVEKDTTGTRNLNISQCYFIGEKNSSPVQGAVYAEGPGVHVDHCIFYGCKNAVLIFEKPTDFSLTHSIIHGAYECAVWYGYQTPDEPFVFSNNIVTGCHYFWAAAKGMDHHSYVFAHSLICDNENGVGSQNGQGGVMPFDGAVNFTETGIRHAGTVRLIEVKTEGIPQGYLNLAPDSDGQDLGAGIYISKKIK